MSRGPQRLGFGLVGLALLLACGPGAPPAGRASAPAAAPAGPAPANASAAAPASAQAAGASAAPATAAAASNASRPALVTEPAINLTVNVLPVASFGPCFVAQERGYF